MENIATSYNNSTIITNEIGIAMEDFTYGGYVKLQLPSLTPFVNPSTPLSDIRTINTSNILNMNPENLQFTPCQSNNFLEISVPEELYRYKNYHDKIPTYKGYRGEKFLVSFIGGDINKPVIVRRL